jgi:hypothetical protein
MYMHVFILRLLNQPINGGVVGGCIHDEGVFFSCCWFPCCIVLLANISHPGIKPYVIHTNEKGITKDQTTIDDENCHGLNGD